MHDYLDYLELHRDYLASENEYHKARSVKKLPNDWVIDEEQSVRWNREQVETHNLGVEANKKACLEAANAKYMKYKNELKKAVKLDLTCSDDTAEKVLTYVDDKLYNDTAEDEKLEAIDELVELIRYVLKDSKQA